MESQTRLWRDGLLPDILDPNLTPIQVCQYHNITLAQLRSITESDEYKQALEDIAAINASRREAINDQLRTEALASAADLIRDAVKHAEDNRTNITHPRESTTASMNTEAFRRALAAATRQHAANARILETRRKAINTILRECKPPDQPPRPADRADHSPDTTPQPNEHAITPCAPPSSPSPKPRSTS